MISIGVNLNETTTEMIINIAQIFSHDLLMSWKNRISFAIGLVGAFEILIDWE